MTLIEEIKEHLRIQAGPPPLGDCSYCDGHGHGHDCEGCGCFSDKNSLRLLLKVMRGFGYPLSNEEAALLAALEAAP